MQVFRKIEESDIEQIASLEQQIFTDAWTSQGIGETYCQKQAFITVSEEEGRINGYCIIYYVLDEGEIARIAVDSNFRKQGIGHRLLDYTSSVCREKGVTRLLLDVRESNQGARAFYKNCGFAEDGIRKNFYENPTEHAVLMSMDIG